jgi:methionine-rich copper-binding protein CopC
MRPKKLQAMSEGDLFRARLDQIRFSGHSTGVIAQLHLDLDDRFSYTLGQPLLRKTPRHSCHSEADMMRSMTMLTLALTLVVGTSTANAHALLERAQPQVGSSVQTAPRQVTLSFTQRLEPSFSSITVTDSSGQQVSADRASVSGTTMSVPLRAIGPGTYQVNWRALSVDTHTTEGSFSFTVGGP